MFICYFSEKHLVINVYLTYHLLIWTGAYLHIPEDVVPLAGEVVLHEGLLTTTVPQVQGQVPQQSEAGSHHNKTGPIRENIRPVEQAQYGSIYPLESIRTRIGPANEATIILIS